MDIEPASDTHPGRASGARAGRPAWVRYLPLLAIFTGLAVIWFSGLTDYLSFEKLLASREKLAGLIDRHLVLSLLIFAGIYILAVAMSVPGSLIMTLAGGFLFGGWLAGVVVVFAATVGATILFIAARTSLGETLAHRAGPWIGRLREGFQEDEVSYMLFLRLVPVFPFWLVNLAPAILGVNLRNFVWTTLVGIAPGTFAYALAGAGIDSVAGAQKRAFDACMEAGKQGCTLSISPQQLVTKELILAFAAIGLVALIPVVLKRMRGRGKTRSAPMSERL